MALEFSDIRRSTIKILLLAGCIIQPLNLQAQDVSQFLFRSMPGNQTRPLMSNGVLVWADDRNNNQQDVYMLVDGKETQITDSQNNEYPVDFEGDFLLWAEFGTVSKAILLNLKTGILTDLGQIGIDGRISGDTVMIRAAVPDSSSHYYFGFYSIARSSWEYIDIGQQPPLDWDYCRNMLVYTTMPGPKKVVLNGYNLSSQTNLIIDSYEEPVYGIGPYGIPTVKVEGNNVVWQKVEYDPSAATLEKASLFRNGVKISTNYFARDFVTNAIEPYYVRGEYINFSDGVIYRGENYSDNRGIEPYSTWVNSGSYYGYLITGEGFQGRLHFKGIDAPNYDLSLNDVDGNTMVMYGNIFNLTDGEDIFIINNFREYLTDAAEYQIVSVKPIQVIEDVPLVRDKPLMTRVEVKMDGMERVDGVRIALEFDDGNPPVELVRTLLNFQGATYAVPEAHVDWFLSDLRSPNPDLLKTDLYRFGFNAVNFEYNREGRTPAPRKEGNLTVKASLRNIRDGVMENNEGSKTVKVKKWIKADAIQSPEYQVQFVPAKNLAGRNHRMSLNQLQIVAAEQARFLESISPVPAVKVFFADIIVTDLSVRIPGIGAQIAPEILIDRICNLNYAFNGLDRTVHIFPDSSLSGTAMGQAWPLVGSKLVFIDESSVIHVTAHEISHTYGSVEEYDKIRNYFYTAANGWDVMHIPTRSGSRQSLEVGNYSSLYNYYTHMGNAGVTDPWITAENYRILADKLLSGGNDPRLLVVSGFITEGDSVLPLPFYSWHGIQDSIPGGNYFIECRDAGGNLLNSTAFEPYRFMDTTSGKSLSSYCFSIPYPEVTSKLVVKHYGLVLKEIPRSTNEPVINVEGVANQGNGKLEIRWNSFDADGDSLTFLLAYSNNSGNNWIFLDNELAGSVNSFVFDGSFFAGGDDCLVRVIATDGMNTVEKISSRFSVPLKAPSVEILRPDSGPPVVRGYAISFEGAGYDKEDGILPDSSFDWYSDIDGEIGKGRGFISSGLSSGDHNITLTATDSDGKIARDSVTVTILPSTGIDGRYPGTQRMPCHLFQNYPNPFSSSTKIRFCLPERCFVSLKVYNSLGVEVETLCGNLMDDGEYTFDFRSKSHPDGIYYYRLQAGKVILLKKMLLMR